MTDRCLEIAVEIRKLLEEFKENMPKKPDIELAWSFVSYSMLSLCNRMYKEQTEEMWLKAVMPDYEETKISE